MMQIHEPRDEHDRYFCFRRWRYDGSNSVLGGANTWARTPAEALKRLQRTWGRTAKEGWYAEEIPPPNDDLA